MQTIDFYKKKNAAEETASLPEDTSDAYKAAEGDVAAFERLVRKYEKYVCTTVFSVVRN